MWLSGLWADNWRVRFTLYFYNETGHEHIEGASGISPLLIKLFPTQPMASEVNEWKGQTTTPGTMSPTLIEQWCGFFNVPYKFTMRRCRRQGQRRDHLNWDKVLSTASMILSVIYSDPLKFSEVGKQYTHLIYLITFSVFFTTFMLGIRGCSQYRLFSCGKHWRQLSSHSLSKYSFYFFASLDKTKFFITINLSTISFILSKRTIDWLYFYVQCLWNVAYINSNSYKNSYSTTTVTMQWKPITYCRAEWNFFNLSPDQTVTTFVSIFSQHLLRADVEAVWHPLSTMLRCCDMLRRVWIHLNFVSISSQHFISFICSWNVERLLLPFDRTWSQHDSTNVETVWSRL